MLTLSEFFFLFPYYTAHSAPIVGAIAQDKYAFGSIVNFMDLNLDSLLGNNFPGATFHDSLIVRIHVDFVTGTAELHCLIFIDRSNNMNTYSSGILKFTRILFFALEPPHSEFMTNKPLWVTSDGRLPNPEVKIEMNLPTKLPKDTFMHYFYSSSTNSFMVVAAGEASFTWENIMEESR